MKKLVLDGFFAYSTHASFESSLMSILKSLFYIKAGAMRHLWVMINSKAIRTKTGNTNFLATTTCPSKAKFLDLFALSDWAKHNFEIRAFKLKVNCWLFILNFIIHKKKLCVRWLVTEHSHTRMSEREIY